MAWENGVEPVCATFVLKNMHSHAVCPFLGVHFLHIMGWLGYPAAAEALLFHRSDNHETVLSPCELLQLFPNCPARVAA